MAKRLNAELWDKMHYLFRDFNDSATISFPISMR